MDGRRKRELRQLNLFLLVAGQRFAQDHWVAVVCLKGEILRRAQVEWLDQIILDGRQIGEFGIKSRQRSAQRLCHYQIGIRWNEVAQQRNALAQCLVALAQRLRLASARRQLRRRQRRGRRNERLSGAILELQTRQPRI
jgi:hypothetical protein